MNDVLMRKRPRRVTYYTILLVALLACLGAAAFTWSGSGSDQRQHSGGLKRQSVPPIPQPVDNRLKPLTPEQATAINAAILPVAAPIEPARPFTAPDGAEGGIGKKIALDCLTAAVYYEAASETAAGQRAVAQVVLNRVRHPAFPKSVCGVVYQGSERATGCQFSFTCDGSLSRHPSPQAWDRARLIAAAALGGVVEPSVGMATHYHTNWVVPYWASSLSKLTTIGSHIFYRWNGFWGRRTAFTGRYAGELEQALQPVVLVDQATAAVSLPDEPQVASPLPPSPIIADRAGTLAPDRSPLEAKKSELLADSNRGVLKADERGTAADD